ncbi:MAG TPA: selenium-binding protein SBP56-related protein [Blastocatellia bacterium]|nr:selenium-binding protein SBP56-related protein [Blastocatellia bacterium]
MTRLADKRNWLITLGALLIVGGLCVPGRTRDSLSKAKTKRRPPASQADHLSQAGGPEKFLYVWAGDQARSNADFLAVVDFDESSANYGRVFTTIPLPAPGNTGNEPHHVGLSNDGRVLACGGLLSVLKGQREIFFFDVSEPAAPRFITSADPPLSAITDEFYPLPDGGFLVTMMGGAQGHAPGRVAEFNQHMELVAEHPARPPEDGFNPHGISVRPEINLMVTSDFICPSTTLHAVPGDLDLRGSVRVWDFRERQIIRTIRVRHPSRPFGIARPAGTIDVKLIPGDPRARAYTAGMTDDQLYLVETSRGTAQSVFDFSRIAAGGWPQLMRMTKDGKLLFVSMNLAGKVAMFETSRPQRPRLLKVLDLGPNSGPHYIALTRDEKRLIISDYFLNEDGFGKVHAEGDHKIHVAKVTSNDLELDPRFELDFNTAFMTGPARPHGVAFK